MDELSATSRTERVVFMKGAQLGGTEVGLNWVGYVVHHIPGPMLMVQPTVETAKRVSKQRVDSLVEACPDLPSRIKDPRSRDSGNTLLMKEFPGGVLMLTGANSAVGLRSMPVRFLFLDEVDAYPADAGGEGDPVGLAVQRSATFTNRKVFLCSTPTLKDYSRIETAYEESDKRFLAMVVAFFRRYSGRTLNGRRGSGKMPRGLAPIVAQLIQNTVSQHCWNAVFGRLPRRVTARRRDSICRHCTVRG
jgi:phage terminase large subunit GpA-like protein